MNSIFRILKSASNLKRHYFLISFLTILVSLMGLLQPMLSGWAIDELRKGSGSRVKYVVLIAVAIFVMDLFSNLFSNVSGYVGDRMAVKLNRTLSNRYYEHVLSLPQQYFDKELSGKIVSRLSRSISQITNFMNMMSNNFLQFIFGTIFALIAVATYSPVVALLLLLLYPIYITMTFKTSGKWQKYQATINKHLDIANGRFTEAIGQVRVVKSFIQERRELKFFQKELDVIVDTEKPQSQLWHKKDFERRLVLNVIFFAVYLYILIEAAHGVFTPGQAVALILYATQIRIPIFTISFLVENTQKAIADSKDYFEIMAIKPQIDDHPDAKELIIKEGNVEFKNVSFAYDHIPVLKNINITLKSGSKVALVGESGEGKTTITNLLMRLYEPQEGQIIIDGQNINNVTQVSLRRNIAAVFQDSALFSGTITENIGYANPQASSADILSASKAANAHEFIEKFDNKYDTEIGERGLKLSGGQKQRIAIARALLKNSPILVLDEATSSLDSKSEMMVQDALEQLMKGRTTLIIAHRLSTIQNVDTIITLKNGKVDEIGSPEKLASSGGIYTQLLKLQRGRDPESIKESLKAYEISA